MKRESKRPGGWKLLWLLPPLLLAALLLMLRMEALPTAPTQSPAPTPEAKIESDDELVEAALLLCREQGSAARGEIDTKLDTLRERDPARARAWSGIFEELYAAPARPIPESGAPEGLPEDGRLCIVVFGFELEPDGGMKPELVGRCEAALACAEAYPAALIILTGGHTAADDPKASEARAMAAWLTEQGVDPARLVLEERSLSTVQNAVYVDRILREEHPAVDSLLIVSSSYHVPMCALLMEETAWLSAGEAGNRPYTVCARRGYPAESSYDFANHRLLSDTVRSTAALWQRMNAA